MEEARASRTALAAAAYRAAHQVVEQGRIFRDPLALRILGADAGALVRDEGADAARRMRIFIAARSRFAEDHIVAAIERGLRQVVILGAGLDTFAYRTPAREGLRIFEVDHPATQAGSASASLRPASACRRGSRSRRSISSGRRCAKGCAQEASTRRARRSSACWGSCPT